MKKLREVNQRDRWKIVRENKKPRKKIECFKEEVVNLSSAAKRSNQMWIERCATKKRTTYVT